MKKETIDYTCKGKRFRGYLVYNQEDTTPKPCVIIAHAWKGLDAFAKQKAEFLAELGYVAFAADLYGEGKNASTNEDAWELMHPLFINRKELRDRISAAYETVSALECVDRTMIGAIGFCFGGMTVLELLRSGLKLRGIVSFHGLLGNALGEDTAKETPAAPYLHGSVLLLHGHQDPMVSPEDIASIQKELSDARIDWQMHTYGQAAHAFTNPQANDPQSGLMYHPKSEQRSFETMKRFFEEVFE